MLYKINKLIFLKKYCYYCSSINFKSSLYMNNLIYLTIHIILYSGNHLEHNLARRGNI